MSLLGHHVLTAKGRRASLGELLQTRKHDLHSQLHGGGSYKNGVPSDMLQKHVVFTTFSICFCLTLTSSGGWRGECEKGFFVFRWASKTGFNEMMGSHLFHMRKKCCYSHMLRRHAARRLNKRSPIDKLCSGVGGTRNVRADWL